LNVELINTGGELIRLPDAAQHFRADTMARVKWTAQRLRTGRVAHPANPLPFGQTSRSSR
jgi:hypothetical protein